MKVVFCASEVAPFAKTGGLADVCGSLSVELEKENVNVLVIMPFYKSIDAAKFNIKKLSQDIYFSRLGSVDIYFIKHDRYFNREGFYGTAKGDYTDNLERFSFFCNRALRFLKEINFSPDVIHCHDWQTSLIPVYLKQKYAEDSFFAKTKSILTIHNLAYQGLFPLEQFSTLGLSDTLLRGSESLEFYDKICLLKGGIVFSDRVTTVSHEYAQEIRRKEFGCGLEGVINYRKDKVLGILNGIDIDFWNPEKDPFIAKQYSVNKQEGKKANKEALQKDNGLRVSGETPVFGFVGRLSQQKGFELLSKAIEKLVAMDIQLIFQGVGEEKYHNLLLEWKKKYAGNVSVNLKFDEKLAHQIYAGSDFFMLPSVYEPCGLSQMISFRYGTVPVVYKTGGLVDTVMPFKVTKSEGDGFVFTKYEPKAFLKAVEIAVKVYKNKKTFQELITQIMKYDFSWANSAKDYKRLYKQCLS